MCYQILLGNATNQEHLQLCSFRTFDGINIWADANHWRLPRFKMSCCTWASFKTLVFVGMLTAKFWAYLNPQSEPQFYNRFLKKLSQCCFRFKKKRMDKSVLMYFANQPASQKEKAFGREQQGEPEFIAQSWRSNLFLEIFRRNEWINNLWCVLVTSRHLLLQKNK